MPPTTPVAIVHAREAPPNIMRKDCWSIKKCSFTFLGFKIMFARLNALTNHPGVKVAAGVIWVTVTFFPEIKETVEDLVEGLIYGSNKASHLVSISDPRQLHTILTWISKHRLSQSYPHKRTTTYGNLPKPGWYELPYTDGGDRTIHVYLDEELKEVKLVTYAGLQVLESFLEQRREEFSGSNFV